MLVFQQTLRFFRAFLPEPAGGAPPGDGWAGGGEPGGGGGGAVGGPGATHARGMKNHGGAPSGFAVSLTMTAAPFLVV